MRSIPLSLLAALLLACSAAQAEETPSAPVSSDTTHLHAQINDLQQRLAQSEQMRSDLESNSSALQQRLRQENQRLRLQLKESQAQMQPGLLSEEQTWFAIGGAVSLISVLFGALLRGQRKTRREWIN
jgi:septal ring factor EnvC (AmiA/AmiB activator)